MEVSIDTIKKLRDATNVSISKCKEALMEADGDIDKARDILREKGTLAASKKQDRELGAGAISSYIHTTGRVGSMVELLSETDFVSGNEDFVELARNIAIHIAAMQPSYLSKEDVPEDVIEQLKVELMEEIGETSVPVEQILEGKLNKRLEGSILLDQAYLKDQDKTIRNLIEEAVQKFGERVEVGRFIVWTI